MVEIWLTRGEKRDERVQKELKLVYQSFKGTGYTVATFLSGDQDLADTASGLICYNRKRIAQLEVEREKKLQLDSGVQADGDKTEPPLTADFQPVGTSMSAAARGAGVKRHTAAKHYELIREMAGER